MMENIRTAANSVIVKIIFGVIILAFIFTGVGGFLGFGGNSADDERLYIAKVDGEGISRSAFEREAQQVTQNAGALGNNDDALQKFIRQSVLNSQIDDYLSYKFAESLNTKTSDQQIKNVIRQQSVFFENGSFSNKRYLELLAANNFTPDGYAEALRSSITKQQVTNALILSDFILPKDSDISALINQTRTVYYTNYSLENMSGDFDVSDTDIENYYNEHKEQYTHPARLKMKYVINPYPEIEQEMKITDDEIKNYYAQDKIDLFSTEKRLYSILTFDSMLDANKQYQSMLNMDNESRLSTQMETLGWFSINEQLPDILIEKELTKIGSIAKPIEQSGSYYIVRLDKIEPAKKLPFDYAKPIISRAIIKNKTDEIYNEQQTRLEKASKLATMEDIAKASGLPLYESEWTTKDEILSIGRFPTIRDIIFSELMVKDEEPTDIISDIIYSPEYNSTFIIQVTDYENAGISSFEEMKDTIEKHLQAKKKKELFNNSVENVVAQLKEKGSAAGVKFSQRVTVDRQGGSDTTLNKKAVDEIFSIVLNHKNRGYSAVLQSEDKAQIFTLIDVKDGEVTDISTELKNESLKNNQYHLSDNLRSKAKIEIMPNANL